MRVVGVQEFGGPEALQVFDVPEPHAGPGQVRIRVRAATVNPTDTAHRAGWYAQRLTEQEPPYVPGMDAAGVIDEVGDGATSVDGTPWESGDEVMAIVLPTGPRKGAYAEQIVVPATSVARAPKDTDFVAASGLPMNGLTARASLDELRLQPGQTLAVTGAAGAYGGYVIQLAKADGLRVIADASEADEPLIRGLGADDIVRRGDAVAAAIRALVPEGVDGLADGAVQSELVTAAVKDGGGMAVVRGWSGDPGRGITVHKTMVVRHAEDAASLDRLRQQVEDGTITLRIARTFPAGQAADAHRALEAGGVRGRLVLTFD